MANRPVIAIDTESVGLGPGGKKSGVAQVTLVDRTGNVIYNAYIKRYGVTDYRTKYSGLTREILDKYGTSFVKVKRDLLDILDNDIILVGHSLHHDLRGLGICRNFDIRDTSQYWRYKKIPIPAV